MKFDPTTKEDRPSIKPGTYAWRCMNAEERVGQNSGYAYLNLTLAVQIPGFDRPITVYDVLSAHPSSLPKVENFCQVNGFNFVTGELDAGRCINTCGTAQFVLGKSKSCGRQYLEVKTYLPPASRAPAVWAAAPAAPASVPASAAEPPPTGDEIPF